MKTVFTHKMINIAVAKATAGVSIDGDRIEETKAEKLGM